MFKKQMIKTLGIFLSSKEKKMSRVAGKTDGTLYEPDLFLQGILMVSLSSFTNLDKITK